MNSHQPGINHRSGTSSSRCPVRQPPPSRSPLTAAAGLHHFHRVTRPQAPAAGRREQGGWASPVAHAAQRRCPSRRHRCRLLRRPPPPSGTGRTRRPWRLARAASARQPRARSCRVPPSPSPVRLAGAGRGQGGGAGARGKGVPRRAGDGVTAPREISQSDSQAQESEAAYRRLSSFVGC